jgi:hypothetical protein
MTRLDETNCNLHHGNPLCPSTLQMDFGSRSFWSSACFGEARFIARANTCRQIVMRDFGFVRSSASAARRERQGLDNSDGALPATIAGVLSLTDDRYQPVYRMQCSTERLEGPESRPWHVALRGAMLIRDSPSLISGPRFGGPVSAAHHCASLRHSASKTRVKR